MTEAESIKAKLADPYWRLNNLYRVINEKGEEVTFRMNWAQQQLYSGMWYLNLILKARQLGMTTFIQLFMLDRCLFNANVNAGVIAHNREDAEDFFSKKIGYAYNKLPDWLKERIPTVGDSAKQLEFENGSSLRVGTSLRSGTYQYLHVSEFGKICAKYPDKAEEIITGSLNTVHVGQFVFIESTAEGAYGQFHDMCQTAKAHAGPLSEADYKLFFFPWFQHPSYRMAPQEIPEGDEEYFRSLEKHGITLNAGQKTWYVKKKATQKGLMAQEYPSTPDEAFMRISEHAIYGKEMGKARAEGRIGDFPYIPGKPVYAFFDIGRSKTDQTSIWFMQDTGSRYRFIDYCADVMKPVGHYAHILQTKGYVYGRLYIPHDGGHNDFNLQTYEDHLMGLGYSNVDVVPRIANVADGINLVRNKLPLCEFDKEKCADGILALESYQYEYDERKGTYIKPLHNWASHPSDAFRQFAQGYSANRGWDAALKPQNVSRRRADNMRPVYKPDSKWVV